MRKTTFLSILIIVLFLGVIGFDAYTEDQVPNINVNTSSGNVNIQMDDLSIYSKTKLVYLKNLTASEVEPFIRTRLSKFGKVQINDQENLLIVSDREPKLTDIVNLIQDLDKIGKKDFMRLETEIIDVQFIKASQAKGIALQRMSTEGTIQADDDLNVLIITDVKSKIDQFRKIISLLDRPYKQVVIETRIIEKQKEKNNNTGIDWANLLNTSISYNRTTTTDDNGSSFGNSNTSSFSLGFSTRIGDVLKILNENGTIKLVASPKVIGMNNRLAQISTVDEDSTISLRISPIIGSREYITLNLEATVGSMANPSSRESISSSIIVKNNESFVIGGLTKISKGHTVKRVPLLGNILPFIFSSKVETEVVSELAFVITPHIVETPVTPAEDLKALEGEIK